MSGNVEHRKARRATSRRGSTYVTVMITAMIVTVIGLGSLFVVRAHSRTLELQADAAEARQYAHSAVEVGQWYMQSNSSWRTARPHGVWTADVELGSGTYTLEVLDPEDSDLANWAGDAVVIKGTGRRGLARQMIQVTMDPAPEPLDLLRAAIHTAGQINVQGGQTLQVGGALVSTNTTLLNSGTIEGDVEAAAAVSLGVITGSVTLLAPAKDMPGATVFSQYAARGTAISPGDTIENIVISPDLNPWGEGNKHGIYVITSSSDVTIRNCRVLGTLVIRVDAGRKVRIEDTVLLETANPDYPALIVQGDLELDFDGGAEALLESDVGVNLNPAGAPYEGETDSDIDDKYPSEIVGLVHATGRIWLTSNGRVRGAIIAESNDAVAAVDVSGNFEIVYDATLYTNPPIGYGTSAMAVRPGTWVRIVD